MSLNYCEKNPVQGTLNHHCYHHDEHHPGHHRDGVHFIVKTCCWCRLNVFVPVFIQHGPHVPPPLTQAAIPKPRVHRDPIPKSKRRWR